MYNQKTDFTFGIRHSNQVTVICLVFEVTSYSLTLRVCYWRTQELVKYAKPENGFNAGIKPTVNECVQYSHASEDKSHTCLD